MANPIEFELFNRFKFLSNFYPGKNPNTRHYKKGQEKYGPIH